MDPIEQAAKAAWEYYAREQGIGTTYEGLAPSAQGYWNILAQYAIEAYNRAKREQEKDDNG